jgi:hypothetical protein
MREILSQSSTSRQCKRGSRPISIRLEIAQGSRACSGNKALVAQPEVQVVAQVAQAAQLAQAARDQEGTDDGTSAKAGARRQSSRRYGKGVNTGTASS